MINKIAVIGCGLSGTTVASLIKKKNKVEIFEKSKGVGGRMSTRKEPPFTFDHGAQFFKIKTTEFENFVSELFSEKIIRPWGFRLAYFDENNLQKIKIIKKKDQFFVGTPNMDSIVKYKSQKCKVILNTKIKKIFKKNNKWFLTDQNKKSYGNYDWIILSLPAEQSLELINQEISFYSALKKIKMNSCISLMIGMNEKLHLNYDAALIENNDVAWLAINNSKPCRAKYQSLLINSSYEFASRNINSPIHQIIKHLLNVTSDLVKNELSNSELIKLHKWKYVEAKKSPNENYFIDHKKKIAICGDWFVNSRVEGAFTSAYELSKEINSKVLL